MSSSPPAFAPAADRRNALDRAHIGDIEGALGTVRAFDTGPRLSARRKLATLFAVLGPGIVVMVADNDAGTISVFAQAGQNHGMRLLWVLLLLCPALYVTQEMVVRLGAVTGSGHARLTLERFGKLWCAFSLSDLLILNLADYARHSRRHHHPARAKVIRYRGAPSESYSSWQRQNDDGGRR